MGMRPLSLMANQLFGLQPTNPYGSPDPSKFVRIRHDSPLPGNSLKLAHSVDAVNVYNRPLIQNTGGDFPAFTGPNWTPAITKLSTAVTIGPARTFYAVPMPRLGLNSVKGSFFNVTNTGGVT